MLICPEHCEINKSPLRILKKNNNTGKSHLDVHFKPRSKMHSQMHPTFKHDLSFNMKKKQLNTKKLHTNLELLNK